MRLASLFPISINAFSSHIFSRAFSRAMSDVAQFVSAAQKADPALVGAEKEQAAVTKAGAETESLASDLKVND